MHSNRGRPIKSEWTASPVTTSANGEPVLAATGLRPDARAFTPAEAADWLHQHLGGRKRKSAAIRKLMRSGLRGVVLRSFYYGRELRTTEADLQRFLQEIRVTTERSIPISRASRQQRNGDPPTHRVDPADEITAARSRFTVDHSAAPSINEDLGLQIHLFPERS